MFTDVKMKRWDEAILDCNAVLSMEPANIKGQYIHIDYVYEKQFKTFSSTCLTGFVWAPPITFLDHITH